MCALLTLPRYVRTVGVQCAVIFSAGAPASLAVEQPFGTGGRCLMSEASGDIFAVTDDDLLEILNAPQVSDLAHRAEIEGRHAERLRPH